MQIEVVGAGGHAAVVIATAQALGIEVTGVYDDDPALAGGSVLDVAVRGRVDDLAIGGTIPRVIAIGRNTTRKAIVERVGGPFATLVHPSAVVHASVTLGAGAVVFAGAVIQPRARVGAHAIINTRASIDHDCAIGSYALIGPGVSFSGDVAVGEGTLVGAGVSAIPGARIGAWATVGAGAAVVAPVADGVTAVGVPARPVPGRR